MDVVATTAAVLGCAILVWLNWSRLAPHRPKLPDRPVSLVGAALRGNDSAPVVIIEFSDYQCPYCARAERDLVPELSSRYISTGKVQLAFRHHPIEQLHPGATRAAAAALCAGREGRFWEMHAALFREPKQMERSALLSRARSLGLDEDRFEQCLGGEVARQLEADAQEADSLGLTGTPAFLVGARQEDGDVEVVAVIRGARPIGDFEAAINEALQGPRPHSHTTAWFVVLIAATIFAVGISLGIKGRRGARLQSHA